MKLQTSFLLILWFLALFHPFRLLDHFLGGGLAFLYKTQTLLLYFMTLWWAISKEEKEYYPVFMLIVISHIFGSLFIAENTGYAREVTRIIFEAYLLALITFSFFRGKKIINSIFTLLLLSFCYWAIWGIIGNGQVSWDYALSDENQFGIYMSMGAIFSYFYFLGHTLSTRKLLGIVASGLCLIGAIVSFSRGTFLTIIVCGIIIWWKSKKKLLATAVVIFGTIAAFIAANKIYPENQYWNEMRTILDGTAESTALDRTILWKIAVDEFLDNPIFGVGPHNFGILASKYATDEALVRYPDLRTLWGRSLHNIYFQTLCEQGIIGIILFIALLTGFFKKNKAIRQYLGILTESTSLGRTTPLNELTQYYHFAQAIQFAMLCYLIGGFFYPIYEYDWLWHLLILNLLLFLVIVKDQFELENTSD